MISIARRTLLIVLLGSQLLLTGCIESPYFQKQVAIPDYEWDYAFSPTFDFEVTDTTYLYNVYFLMRHTEAYPYANVWMNIYTKTPEDTAFKKQRVNVPLAATSGKNNGQWLGRGMGEIWEHKLRLTEGDSTVLQRKGKYTIRFEQDMRINPLPEVLQVGLRVEKGNKRMP